MTRALLATALALATPAAAERVEMGGGPALHLDGAYGTMEGPAADVRFRFPRPGWVSSLSVGLRDVAGKPADGRGLLCHSYLRDPGQSIGREFGAVGARRTTFSLGSDDGSAAVRLPPGFGLAVDTTTLYHFEARLQNPEPKDLGLFAVDFAFDFSTAPLRSLEAYRVGLSPREPVRRRGAALQWEVPPGKHRYSSDFSLPEDFDVHVINFHLHRWVTRLELTDVETGRTIYEADVVPLPTGRIRPPVYSSATPIPLKKSRSYRLQAAYDNASDKTDLSMVVMWFYAARAL